MSTANEVNSLNYGIDAVNQTVVFSVASVGSAALVERFFPRVNYKRPVFFDWLESILELSLYLLLSTAVAGILDPFVYGFSEPALFVLFTPLLLPQCLRKLERTYDWLYSIGTGVIQESQ